MLSLRRLLKTIGFTVFFAFLQTGFSGWALEHIEPSDQNKLTILAALAQANLNLGDQVFLRIFKQSGPPRIDLAPQGKGYLELWMRGRRNTAGVFTLVKTFEIDHFAGKLGPKLLQGDMQAPEGFYAIANDALNDLTDFHLTMNVGYPNEYDEALGRTGDYILIHGMGISLGCYSLTDDSIEQLYYVVRAVLQDSKVQTEVPVHIFPFEMTEKNIRQAPTKDLRDFWTNLAYGYSFFEMYLVPPVVKVKNNQYTFQSPK